MIKSKGDRPSSRNQRNGRSNARADQSEKDQAMNHLKDIFSKEMDEQIIEDIFVALNCDCEFTNTFCPR
jgi:hypothetical protein